MDQKLPPTFAITVDRQGFRTWRLKASQVLPLPLEETFVFFRDPRNLGKLIPEALEFTLVTPPENLDVHEGAEFDYTIRWFGMRLKWRSRIVEYQPPRRFADIQLVGPYSSWRHLHTFDEVPEGTLLGEEVTYKIPFEAVLLEQTINRQLQELFGYRAIQMAAWATETSERTRGDAVQEASAGDNLMV